MKVAMERVCRCLVQFLVTILLNILFRSKFIAMLRLTISLVFGWSIQKLNFSHTNGEITGLWHVLRSQMEGRPLDTEGSCEYIE
jgi:hypothetical protein